MKVKSESEVAQLCLTLSDPMDCSLPGSSVHGIFQARVLEWGAIMLIHLKKKYANTLSQFGHVFGDYKNTFNKITIYCFKNKTEMKELPNLIK